MITHLHIVTQQQVIRAIARIREEWQDAAGKENLLEVQGSVGLLLLDLALALGFTSHEISEALGDVLATELEGMLPVCPGGNGRNC
jgi:hypothetical protein